MKHVRFLSLFALLSSVACGGSDSESEASQAAGSASQQAGTSGASGSAGKPSAGAGGVSSAPPSAGAGGKAAGAGGASNPPSAGAGGASAGAGGANGVPPSAGAGGAKAGSGGASAGAGGAAAGAGGSSAGVGGASAGAAGSNDVPPQAGAGGADAGAGGADAGAGGADAGAGGDGGSGAGGADAGAGGADAGAGGAIGGGDIPPVVFLPSSLPGTILWLEAGKSLDVDPNTNKVRVWADLSSNGQHVLQNDVMKRPLLTTVDGKPALEFHPGQYLSRSSTYSAPFAYGTEDVTLAIVARDNGTEAGSAGVLFQKCNQTQLPNGGLLSFMNVDSDHKWAGSSALLGEIIDTPTGVSMETHAMIYQRRGTELTLRLDGALMSSKKVSAIVDGTNSDPLFVGNRADGKHPAHSYIFEIVVVRGEVSPEDTAKLEGYLLGKYK